MAIELGTKIVILGTPGSGKTTLAKLIAKRKNLPVVHLDRIGFTHDWNPVSAEMFRASLEETMNKDGWIIDGDSPREVDLRLKAADTIIYVRLNRVVCLLRVVKRLITTKKNPRTDIAPGCGDSFNSMFIRGLKFLWEYDHKHRPFDPSLLDNYRNAKKLIKIESVKAYNSFRSELSGSSWWSRATGQVKK